MTAMETVAFEKIRITILYDNTVHDRRVKQDWGFSCLIEGLDRLILFDTGRLSPVLDNNLSVMGIDRNLIDIVFLSHNHDDHCGGIRCVLDPDRKKTIFLLKSFSEPFRSVIEVSGGDCVNIDKPVQVTEASQTTGRVEGVVADEHSLVINTDKGLVVVTGCAHPGIVNIIEKAAELGGKPVIAAIGGFHLKDMRKSEILAVIDKLKKCGVLYVAPAHCTGPEAIRLFSENYAGGYIGCGAGKIIDFKHLPIPKNE